MPFALAYPRHAVRFIGHCAVEQRRRPDQKRQRRAGACRRRGDDLQRQRGVLAGGARRAEMAQLSAALSHRRQPAVRQLRDLPVAVARLRQYPPAGDRSGHDQLPVALFHRADGVGAQRAKGQMVAAAGAAAVAVRHRLDHERRGRLVAGANAGQRAQQSAQLRAGVQRCGDLGAVLQPDQEDRPGQQRRWCCLSC